MIATTLKIFNHIYVAWLVLALPAFAFLHELVFNERYYAELMYETGLLATQLTVLALGISPLMKVSKGWKPLHRLAFWLQKRRRAIGVAAFAYTAFHTVFYIREIGSLELVLLNSLDHELLTGWIAMFLFTVLALTSNAMSQRWLGTRWKPVQRLAYGAAALTFLHWFLIGQFESHLYWWLVLLLGLQVVRLLWPERKRASVDQPA